VLRWSDAKSSAQPARAIPNAARLWVTDLAGLSVMEPPVWRASVSPLSLISAWPPYPVHAASLQPLELPCPDANRFARRRSPQPR